MGITENGLRIAKERYFWENENSWEDLCNRIVREIMRNEENPKFHEEYLTMLISADFIPAGRILRNLGKVKPSTSNCNVLAIEDNIESIGETLKNYMIISSYGGGTGINFSSLRPKGAPLITKGGTSSGMVEFMKIFNYAGKSIETGGQRRAAAIALCDISHPDVEEFINAKNLHDELTQFNISVILNEDFLKAVEENGDWDLKFSGKLYKRVKARKLWDMILENMIEHAEPGLINWNKLTRNNSYYFAPPCCVNPCLPGWSKILTPEGIRKLSSLKIGDLIWSEDGWVPVLEIYNRGQRNVYKYRTYGGVFYGTRDHKVISLGEKKEVNTVNYIDLLGGKPEYDELSEEERLRIIIDGMLVAHGFPSYGSTYMMVKELSLLAHDIRRFIFDEGPRPYSWRVLGTLKAEELKDSVKGTYNCQVPKKYLYGTPSQKAYFIRGVWASRGYVGTAWNRPNRLYLRTRSEEFAEDLLLMLSSLGFSCRLKEEGASGRVGTKQRTNWILSIHGRDQLEKFYREIGFESEEALDRYWKNVYKNYDDINFQNGKILDREYISTEEVFDIEVEGEHHSFWCGGCNVANCGEIPLPHLGTCNLGSLNLPNFISGKSTNWQKLRWAIWLGIRFLDNIIDLTFYPIPGQESAVKDARRLGLGVMGLADYLLRKEIRYGSEKSLAEIEKLFRFIRNEAYLASIQLASEKGAFPKFEKASYSRAAFVRKLPPKIRLKIKENGIRNCTMLTCPPTGTTSLLVESSSGIEPIICKSYLRKDGVGNRIYIHPLYKKLLMENKQKPNWFVDTFDLTPEDHLEVQSIISKYIDNSVSKTINLPENIKGDELSRLLLEYIYDLKGVTVYRFGSRENQPISPLSYEDTLKSLSDSLDYHEESCARGTCEL